MRATGGLQDTVTDPNEGHGQGNGFKFDLFDVTDLVRAVRRAVETFQNREAWQDMMYDAMARDFSWDHSAKEYLRVFERALTARRGRDFQN